MRRPSAAAGVLAALAVLSGIAHSFVAPGFLLMWGEMGSAVGQFSFPHFLATTPDGDVYVGDLLNHRVQSFSSSGGFIEQWPVTEANGVAVAPDGSVYVSTGDQVSRFTAHGAPLTAWGSTGAGDGQFQFAMDVAVDADGFVYVGDWQNHRIQKFTPTGEFVAKWGSEGEGEGQFLLPFGLAFDPAGYLYVADGQANRIQKFTLQGSFVSSFPVNSPGRPCVDPDGFLIVPEAGNHRLQVFRPDGTFVTEWGSFGTGPGQFDHPTCVAIDATGAIYVMDKDNHRVQKFAAVATPAQQTSWGRLKTRFR